MDAIEALKTRRSCRNFTKEQVGKVDLQTILDCGLNAPSGMNRQDSRIVVIQDSDTVKDMSRLNSMIWGKETDPFYGAPTVCLILVPTDNPNGVKDGSLIIGAMQDAAYAIGVGSCWINRCREMLELPDGKAYLEKWGLEGYEGVGCCILGYPGKEDAPKEIRKGRILWI